MIRITVEMIPHGDETQKSLLGFMEIANDGTGGEMLGNYTGVFHSEYTSSSGRKGRVEGFHRQTQSVWSLVGAFLKLFGHTKHSPSRMNEIRRA
jgi:hypothetical protein